DHNMLTGDGTGILAGAGATVRATRNTVVRNATGLGTETGGQLQSFGDNRVGGNITDGAPTAELNPVPAPTTPTTTTTATTTVATPAPATTTTTTPTTTPIKAAVTCRVPWLVGLTLAQVRKALAGSHCKLGTVSRRVTSRIHDGRAYRQSPKAGRTAANGTKVGISIHPTSKSKVKAKTAVGGGATRTWVSGVGDDANPCSRTAPCLTFNGALAKTATGGTVDVLDPGSYGPATVDGSVTIDAAGNPATVLATPGSNGVTVNAPAGAVVTLRGLTIVNPGGCTTGGTGNGVTMGTGGTLHLEDVVTTGFAGAGVSLAPSGNLVATIQGGRIDGNCTAGISATRPSGSVDVSVVEAQLTGDAIGILAGDGATVRVGGSTLSSDTTALSAPGTGVLQAWSDNAISGNGADGATPTALKLI
ncbi:MAG: hypothetical protein QOK49_2705, partial [Baekduia sp.]|nr:hypothetical protein [Baekduia sp.]